MTQIDTLTIEIQSNSTSAATGIDGLAAALEKLKKSGSVGVAVKNLQNLSDVLRKFTSVSSNANKVGQLADALEKLKAVGSFSVGGSLTKLVSGLKELSGVRVDNVSPQIQKVADALAPLTGLKSGGFGTLVNGLAKIGKVTKSLDDDAIKAFADKIKQLDEIVGPFSRKMTTIQAGLSGVNSTLRRTASSAKEAASGVNESRLNFSTLVYAVQTVVQALQAAIEKFKQFIGQAIEWDGVSARFGRGFGAQAQETYEWIQRLNDEMGINIQQFMQYSSIYANMLTGFGVAHEDATKMALGYTELTYDIWAGYNDIYKTFEEASDAVKSAIAGEVEPIRRAGFTIIESTLEQTAANHGLVVSLEKATEAEKSYLRYLALVDQAQAQSLVGTYAKELNTAEGLMRTFSQQVKSLSQAFGSLFLPILVKIMPYLQAFVELLTEAVYWIAGLFGIEIQPVDWSGYNAGADAIGGVTDAADAATGSLGDAASAAKELKNATLGIDELNVISPPDPTGGSGGGGGGGGAGLGNGFGDLDLDSLWDDSIFAGINSKIDEIKEKFKEWLPVIATIAGALGALAITSLLSHIGEAISKMDLLNKAIATIAVAAIEAALVFYFADNYLEGGGLLNLVGEALTTAGAGYILFKGFGGAAGNGFKGAALAMAVSVAAQLAAITMNLADGGVEMDDPELWIQTAMTTLTGATGGLLFFKGIAKVGAGKGALLGAGITLALSLAAITIGDVASDGKIEFENIMTGLLSTAIGGATAAGLFTLLGIASGGTGFLVGAAIMLAINLIGVAIAENGISKEDVAAELEERLGTIELGAAELEFMVDKITAIPREVTIDSNVWNEALETFEQQTITVTASAALEIYLEEKKTLDKLKDSFDNIVDQLDSQNLRIALGMEVTQEDYQATIDSFVSMAQQYLDQHYLTTSVAIEILNSASSDSLSTTLTEFYSVNSSRLAALGADLKKTVSEGFVDGAWIPNKLAHAMELQKEIQEIVDYAADVEYRAEMQNLKLQVTGEMLTPESFSDVLKGAKTAIEDKLAALEEVKMSNLSVAIMEYDANIDAGMSEAEAKKIYDQTVADIEAAYQNGKVEVSYGSVEFGLDTLKTAFAAEIEKSKKEGWFDIGPAIEFGLSTGMSFRVDDGEGEIYQNITALTSSILGTYERAIYDIEPETRAALESLLEEMKPTMADYEKIAAANQKAGISVPENVRNGLNDVNELKALTGDVDALQYMIGQQLSSDPTFLNTLATARNAGQSIDKNLAQGLYNNMEVIRDEATGVVTGLKNTLTGEVTAVTPTMVENFKQMGIDLTAGLKTGADTEMQAQKKSWKDWAIWPWNWFKEENEINSPSKLFERGGKYLSEGLANGMDKDTVKEKLSDMWDTAKRWWDKKGELSTYTPIIGSIKEKLSDAWTSAKTWWTSKKEKLSTYTPVIGSIKDKLSSAWTTAKNWWDRNKGSLSYTPIIGSIKDKLSSAWSTAKTWWTKHKGSLSYTPTIGSIKDSLVEKWNKAKEWFNKQSLKLNIKTPHFSVGWNYNIADWQKTIANFLFDRKAMPYVDVKWYAQGGFPEDGELFMAREAGPEMVGRIGGRSAVANNEQIVEAISEGVYAAVMAAMGRQGNGGEQAVNVYLDGKQIYTSVKKTESERGRKLMGSQLGYSY